MTRRSFAALLAGGGFAAVSRAAAKVPIAVQLFSIRLQCEKDLEGTLAWVRQIGFEGVEFAGYYGRSASELRKLLSANGLRCCGAHTPLPELSGAKLDQTIEFHKTLGNRYLIVPGLP